MNRNLKVVGLAAAALALLSARPAGASSHREALAILNEPCADNTDTFAWVSDGTHDKLYLIMDFNPLHEPGQGNQGLRACNGYRYEFHIAKGTSLADQAVYRIEFTNTLTLAPPPSPTDSVGGGNELLWQLTGGTETMKVTRLLSPANPGDPTVLGDALPVLPNNEVFPGGIPHNGTLMSSWTDSLLRVWASISRQETQTVSANIITGNTGSGNWVQVGRNALPLFNAGLVGTQRQTMYLHTTPMHDVTNFGADVLFPVLVRDAEALGIYKALGVPAAAVTSLKGPRSDIINAINLGRPIPIADGSTGDVITIDAAIDSAFPNGRRLGGGTAPNRHQVNVNSVLISLIVAGNPAAGLAKGVEVNDKDFLPRFPFLAPAHQGLLQGHGGTNVPTVPNIPVP